MAIFKDFIGVWENALPFDFCDYLVSQFGTTYDKVIFNKSNVRRSKHTGLYRNDQTCILNYHNEHYPMIYEALQPALLEYIDEYQQLAELNLLPSEIKLQRTQPGGGYHIWHYENAGWEVSHRELTWMIYLNDVPDGEGETEFLYQKVRYKPKKALLLIWPAGMTHVHRGNTMLTTDKYILTGWFIKSPR